MRILRPRSRARSRGISLVEGLVGSALSLMALATVLFFFQAQQRALAAQSTYVQSQVVTRTVVDLLARELRMVGYAPCADAGDGGGLSGESAGVSRGNSDPYSLPQALNGDGDTTMPMTPRGSRLRTGRERGAPRDWNTRGGPALTLVSGVPQDGLRFRYFTTRTSSSCPPGARPPSTSPVSTVSPGSGSASVPSCRTQIRE